MKRIIPLLTLVAGATVAWAGGLAVPAADVDAAVTAMFRSVPPDWQLRTVQDETQKLCSETRNNPTPAQLEAIVARETATIVYPADGSVLGDWLKGEKIAQSGAGGQFSDAPDTVKGGNCYACHQMARAELSYGTLGPSLTNYGKDRKFDPAAARAAYGKIFNAQSVQPCSNMPRFGYHKFLSIEQIKDVTAYLMSPESPVNK